MNLKKEKEKILKAESKWKVEKDLLERKQKLKEEKRKLRDSGKKKLTTSKKLIIFLFINCTLIELLTGYAVFRGYELAVFTGLQPDLSPLVTLIGAVVGEVIAYAIYAVKSTKENTVGGITYLNAEYELMGECQNKVDNKPGAIIVEPETPEEIIHG